MTTADVEESPVISEVRPRQVISEVPPRQVISEVLIRRRCRQAITTSQRAAIMTTANVDTVEEETAVELTRNASDNCEPMDWTLLCNSCSMLHQVSTALSCVLLCCATWCVEADRHSAALCTVHSVCVFADRRNCAVETLLMVLGLQVDCVCEMSSRLHVKQLKWTVSRYTVL